ncbi:hypothetical protein B0H13DRAFT_2005147 [Mycena leptocephala]|nr:hypothetical protein B0H13DRAFT_2005147 [Mycena leptocephala]
MYLLSAAYWAYRVADVMSRIQFWLENPQTLQAAHTPVTRWTPLFNASVLLNYLLCDGVVIWRARLICSLDHRKYLYLPLLFLSLTTVAVTGVIGLRIATSSSAFEARFPKAIDTLQVSAFTMSLLSNLSSTGVVGITAWRHRETIRTGFRKTTKGEQILILLVESGVLYCIAGLFALVSSLIRLPSYTTLGDLYTPVNVQIAGGYTPIVLLLVNTQRSLTETSFLGTIPDSSHSLPIHVSPPSPTVSNRTMGESRQFGRRVVELRDAEVDRGLEEDKIEKGHRHHVSAALPV